jgi:hypothetical protein
VAATGVALSNDRAAMLALALGVVVVAAARPFAPAIPAIAAPAAVAWPHGAPAIGAGVLIAATALARPLPRPRLAIGAVLALGAWIGIAGDHGLVRGAAACVAVAVAAPVCIRSGRDFRLAAGAFGLTAAAVALGAAALGVTGARADILAVSAALGLAASAGVGMRSIAAADLAGVLVLPSRAGLIAAAVALVALLVARRLTPPDGLAAAVATGVAWLAGAPVARAAFVHGSWARSSGYLDAYHRLGVVGFALFALLLLAALAGLPRMLMPAALAAGAGAVLVPLEATAPVWLLAGLAAAGASYHRSVASDREQALGRRERELEAEQAALVDAQRRMSNRRAALDDRETELNLPRPPTSEELRRASALDEREAIIADHEQKLRGRDRALDLRELSLTEREAASSAQEAILELRERSDVFLERNQAFREREYEVAELERELAEREIRINERELALEEARQQRAADKTVWELTVARREQQLRERDQAAEEREEALTRREAVAPDLSAERTSEAPRREPARFPWRERTTSTDPVPPPPEPSLTLPRAVPLEEPLQPTDQYWNLRTLRRLVEKRLPEFPERADEWRAYLDILDQQQVDGLLPPSFDGLVREVFAPILDARSA